MLVLLVFGSHPQLRATAYGWGSLPRRGRKLPARAAPGKPATG
jgi:hypothetical protein